MRLASRAAARCYSPSLQQRELSSETSWCSRAAKCLFYIYMYPVSLFQITPTCCKWSGENTETATASQSAGRQKKQKIRSLLESSNKIIDKSENSSQTIKSIKSIKSTSGKVSKVREKRGGLKKRGRSQEAGPNQEVSEQTVSSVADIYQKHSLCSRQLLQSGGGQGCLDLREQQRRRVSGRVLFFCG